MQIWDHCGVNLGMFWGRLVEPSAFQGKVLGHMVARVRKISRIFYTTTATFVFARDQFRDTKTDRELHPHLILFKPSFLDLHIVT